MPACARLVSLAAVVSLALGAAACSNREAPVNKRPHTGDGTASTVAGIQQITITSGPDLRFHPSTITVHPGKIRIVLENRASGGGGAPHNLQGASVPGMIVPLTSTGHTQQVTFLAPAPGRYRFVCTIHEAQGQTGTLVVKPS